MKSFSDAKIIHYVQKETKPEKSDNSEHFWNFMEVNTKLLESPFKQDHNLLTPISYSGWGRCSDGSRNGKTAEFKK